jgi:glycosyltransferase involved in cell wall biosynthesis
MKSIAPLSVVVPVYNNAAHLCAAVRGILRQRYAPLEIVIVDDGSTDDSAKVVQALVPEARYVHQPNRGPAAARNHGLQLARGEIIAFLDGDDVWSDDKLEVQLPMLLADPELDVVLGYCRYLAAGEPGEDAYAPVGEAFLALKVDCALFRRRVFDTIGLFNEHMRLSEDVDWFLRARERRAKVIAIEQIVHLYRLHQANSTRDTRAVHQSLLGVLSQSLARRRRAPGGVALLPELQIVPPDGRGRDQ